MSRKGICPELGFKLIILHARKIGAKETGGRETRVDAVALVQVRDEERMNWIWGSEAQVQILPPLLTSWMNLSKSLLSLTPNARVKLLASQGCCED